MYDGDILTTYFLVYPFASNLLPLVCSEAASQGCWHAYVVRARVDGLGGPEQRWNQEGYCLRRTLALVICSILATLANTSILSK